MAGVGGQAGAALAEDAGVNPNEIFVWFSILVAFFFGILVGLIRLVGLVDLDLT